MSVNLKIVSDVASAEVKLDVIHGDPRKVNGKEIVMKDDGSPKLTYKDPSGVEDVHYVELDAVTQQPLQGRTAVYMDKNGTVYQKSEAKAFYQVADSSGEPTGELIEATKNEKTEVFEVKAWEPVENYLNRYQMDKYYQVRPSPGLAKKDFAKQQAIEANTVELLKLWQHMNNKGVVARGTLNITSAGYLPSVGYLRAVDLGGGKWTFEVAVFRETKPFTWSEDVEFKPTAKATVKPTKGTKATAQVDEL